MITKHQWIQNMLRTLALFLAEYPISRGFAILNFCGGVEKSKKINAKYDFSNYPEIFYKPIF